MPSFDRETRGLKAGLARALLLTLALCMLLAASASAAAPNWLEPADLSKGGRNASNPAVAMDGAGNTVAIWERQSTVDPSFNLQMSTRAVGGSFTAPVDFVLKGTEPQLAVAPNGEAVVAWKHFENPPGVYTIQVATRPPGGGAFSAPVTVYTAPASVIPQTLALAVGAGGDVAVTWSEIDPESEFPDFVCGVNPDPPNNQIFCPNPAFVMATMRPAGGVFTEAERISALPAPKPAGEPAQQEWAEEESVKTAGGARPAVDAAT
jgi:hypothetical protein